MKARLLVVDDEPTTLEAVRVFLERRGYEVTTATTCEEARLAFTARPIDAAIVDYALPDGNALDLLPRLKSLDPTVPYVILTGYGSIALAVRAIQEGADQFLTKPIELPTLLVILERLIESRRDRRGQIATRVARQREVIDPFVGESNAIRQLAERAQRALTSDSPILVVGETGSGKGVLARWLHENGLRAEEAFVDVNCAGLSREFLETELFGHEKGAFTGAAAVKIGLLEVAHKGTFFLDEVGDVDLQVQPKLLKVLEDKRFRRLGGVEDRLVDIRLIAATHQDLEQLVQEKKFRSDLFYRINTLVLHVPPLRERGDDVRHLARHFLARLAMRRNRDKLCLSPTAEAVLAHYDWPGNVRELYNTLERAIYLSDHTQIEAEDLELSPRIRNEAPRLDTRLTLTELERRHIEAVLRETGGRIEAAAKRLGIHRSSLYHKLKRLRIDLSRS